MAGSLRIAYTLEQCWHRVPGGTGVAALRTLDALRGLDGIELVGVAGRHEGPPPPPWDPGIPITRLDRAGARLYASWVLLGRPRVETATGPVDVAHATSIIPCASAAPLVVTVHDLAFVHEPAHFTRWGVALFRRSLRVVRDRAALVLCSSQATADDVLRAGVGADRIRVVPLGVEPREPVDEAELRRVRAAYALPDRYVLFVGTVEPRKNLARLAAAVARLDDSLTLVAAGPAGWGDGPPAEGAPVRFLGFVPDTDLPSLYAGATVVGYPSLREGFGLPVLEAMACGAPVVTSAGTATEEAAGGAAVLVDPTSVEDIAGGLADAIGRRDELVDAGRRRAAAMSWTHTAALTAAAYREVGA